MSSANTRLTKLGLKAGRSYSVSKTTRLLSSTKDPPSRRPLLFRGVSALFSFKGSFNGGSMIAIKHPSTSDAVVEFFAIAGTGPNLDAWIEPYIARLRREEIWTPRELQEIVARFANGLRMQTTSHARLDTRHRQRHCWSPALSGSCRLHPRRWRRQEPIARPPSDALRRPQRRPTGDFRQAAPGSCSMSLLDWMSPCTAPDRR